MKEINIAIDGPASSGKSTVAKILAKNYGYIYTDTGAMYRGVTYLAIKHHVPFSDEEKLVALLDRYPITFEQTSDGQKVYANGEEITEAIRQNDVTNGVSEVSAWSKVREKLVEVQKAIAKNGGVVMDGRDIGTVVLPKADVKIFLTASAEVRAKRRFDELQQKGDKTPYAQILAETKQRDKQDSERAIAPLKQAADAVLLDTSGDTVEQSVNAILDIVRRKLG